MPVILARRQLMYTQALLLVSSLENSNTHGRQKAEEQLNRLIAEAYPAPSNTPKLTFKEPEEIAGYLKQQEAALLAFAVNAIVPIRKTND